LLENQRDIISKNIYENVPVSARSVDLDEIKLEERSNDGGISLGNVIDFEFNNTFPSKVLLESLARESTDSSKDIEDGKEVNVNTRKSLENKCFSEENSDSKNYRKSKSKSKSKSKLKSKSLYELKQKKKADILKSPETLLKIFQAVSEYLDLVLKSEQNY
jgi:trehalose/maltose hydrolase-like predicted phosphorylase